MNNNIDQTQFSVEEPYLEDVYIPTAPVKKVVSPELSLVDESELSEEQLAKRKAQKRNKKILIMSLIFIGVICLVVIILLALMPVDQSEEVISDTQKSEEARMQQKTKVERELEVLKDRLDEIDPTKDYLIVPPVNYEITLE